MPNDALQLEADGDVPAAWRECPDCGLLSVLPEMKPGLVAECPRCHKTLWRMRRTPFRFAIACGIAALLFYTYIIVAPFLEISAYGRFQLARIETGPNQLQLQGFALLGFLVLGVTVIFPGIKLGIMLLTLVGIESRLLSARFLKLVFRWHERIGPWAMVDVYLLGFLVAYTRLIAIANVHLDTALYALICLMVTMAAADASLDPEAVWRALDTAEQDSVARHHFAPEPEYALREPVGPGDLIGCHHCHLVNRAEHGDRCRRCHGVLHMRKVNSVARSWAFATAAVALYIPANIYPVMYITQVAKTQAFTIMGGIIELFEYGLWPLGLLVFFASITIPLFKLLTLAYMLIQTQRRSAEHLIGRTRAFRVIDFIGRWSMIDVFMISILVALVRFGQFANVRASTGAPSFAAVVVLTMFAMIVFDPRLMWDAPRVARLRTGMHIYGETEDRPISTTGLRA
jgi:paraquat-inducible protein A